jgi:Tfp pilus assembly protein PilF
VISNSRLKDLVLCATAVSAVRRFTRFGALARLTQPWHTILQQSASAPRTSRVALVVGFVWLSLFALGCGNAIPPAELAASEGAFDRGLAAFEQQDWAAAEQELTTALDGAGLQPDLYEQAVLMRARARIQTGQLDEASLDLTLLAQGAAEMDQVWAARGELALKQGDKAAATEAYREAQKLNRQIAMPAELK